MKALRLQPQGEAKFGGGRGRMKKKKVAVIFAILGILIIVGFAGAAFLKSRGMLQTGTVVLSEGSCIFLSDDTREPVIIYNQTRNQELFAKLGSGDRVLILGDGTMMLSYPAQMNIYFCLRLDSGDLSDIPEETLEQLKELGW